MTDGDMSAFKPITVASGGRITLTASYPIIQDTHGALRPAESNPIVSSAGKTPFVREGPSEKWEGGAEAPPNAHHGGLCL
jgi:hypothetical protein